MIPGVYLIVLGFFIQIVAAALLTIKTLKIKKYNHDKYLEESNKSPEEIVKDKIMEENYAVWGLYLLVVGFAVQMIGLGFQQIEAYNAQEPIWKEFYQLKQDLIQKGIIDG